MHAYAHIYIYIAPSNWAGRMQAGQLYSPIFARPYHLLERCDLLVLFEVGLAASIVFLITVRHRATSPHSNTFLGVVHVGRGLKSR